MLSADINTAGLIIDIIGVCLLFQFRTKVTDYKAGPALTNSLETGIMETNLSKERDYDSRPALILIIIGFIFQIASNYMN